MVSVAALRANSDVSSHHSRRNHLAPTDSSPGEILEHDPAQYRTFRMRWYVLFITGAAFTWHSFLYLFLTSIARSLRAIFGWKRAIFAMFGNYFPIVTVIFAIPGGWFLNKAGMRKCTICLYVLCLLSCFVRCFPTTVEATTVLAHISSFLCAIPAVFGCALPCLVSATWFAPDERMMATNVGILMNEFGCIFSYLIGPNVVQSPGPGVHRADIADQYYQYTWATTAVTALFTIITVVSLPDKPKVPPSVTAADERMSLMDGYKKMLRSKPFWVLNFVFSVNLAAYATLLAILNLLLEQIEMTQLEAGITGVILSVAVMAFAFVFGLVAGKYHSAVQVVIADHLIGTVGGVWLLLNYYNLIPRSPYSSGIAVILYGVGSSPVLGILQEMAADALFPVSELTLSLVTTFFACVGALVLFAVASVSTISLEWFFWFLPVNRIVAGLAFASMTFETKRSDADDRGGRPFGLDTFSAILSTASKNKSNRQKDYGTNHVQ